MSDVLHPVTTQLALLPVLGVHREYSACFLAGSAWALRPESSDPELHQIADHHELPKPDASPSFEGHSGFLPSSLGTRDSDLLTTYDIGVKYKVLFEHLALKPVKGPEMAPFFFRHLRGETICIRM